jgi:hypothetical protein
MLAIFTPFAQISVAGSRRGRIYRRAREVGDGEKYSRLTEASDEGGIWKPVLGWTGHLEWKTCLPYSPTICTPSRRTDIHRKRTGGFLIASAPRFIVDYFNSFVKGL